MSLFCRGKLIWIKLFVFVDVVYIGTIHPQHYNTGKLFINSRKNVLIEKPLGMNLRQVQELITAAQENNVFLMEVKKSLLSWILHESCLLNVPVWFLQAVWARFFPAYAEVRRLLKQGEVGDVQMVRAEFGLPVSHVPRMSENKLGGGGLVDLGIYPLQLAFMVFNGEKPESIHTSGHCLDTGTHLKTVNLLYCCLRSKKTNLLPGEIVSFYIFIQDPLKKFCYLSY